MKITFDFDKSRNWKGDPDLAKNAKNLATYRDRFGNGSMFVPDISHHTNQISHLHVGETGILSLDGFEPFDRTVADVFTKAFTDGVLVSGLKNAKAPVTVAIRVADCGAVTLRYADEVMAVVHAGWRGMAGGIVRKALGTIRKMVGQENMRLVQVAISPMAVEGYEFGSEDYEKFLSAEVGAMGRPRGKYFQDGANGKGVLRLHDLICDQLADTGVAFLSAQADTLDPGNGWPSHRSFSQGHDHKGGRFLGSVTFTP